MVSVSDRGLIIGSKDPFVVELLSAIGGAAPKDLREATAIHEAGHAVFAIREGFPLHEVIIPTAGELEMKGHAIPKAYAEIGFASLGRRKSSPAALDERRLGALKVLLGGIYAELHRYGNVGRGCVEDLVLATELLYLSRTASKPFPSGVAVLASMPREVKGLWPAIEAFASELVAKSRLDGRRARTLFRRAFPPTDD